jgi:hypothetical protein
MVAEQCERVGGREVLPSTNTFWQFRKRNYYSISARSSIASTDWQPTQNLKLIEFYSSECSGTPSRVTSWAY